MTPRAPSVCWADTCLEIADGGACPAHPRPRRPHARRTYGRAWERLRARVLAATPDCVTCGAPATQVDHIVPLARGGTNALHNLQPLCASCHSKKTVAQNR